jgi:hypothetical protein
MIRVLLSTIPCTRGVPSHGALGALLRVPSPAHTVHSAQFSRSSGLMCSYWSVSSSQCSMSSSSSVVSSPAASRFLRVSAIMAMWLVAASFVAPSRSRLFISVSTTAAFEIRLSSLLCLRSGVDHAWLLSPASAWEQRVSIWLLYQALLDCQVQCQLVGFFARAHIHAIATMVCAGPSSEVIDGMP